MTYQYFNRNNSEIYFIRDLLESTYIPTVRIFSKYTNIQPTNKQSVVATYDVDTTPYDVVSSESNLEVYKNETFILDNKVMLCDPNTDAITGKTYTINDSRDVSRYFFGNRYSNITTNYVSNRNYYDTGMHEALGRYLRAYRDFYHIDVMNFYNCFSNRFISSYSLPIPAYITPYVPTLPQYIDVAKNTYPPNDTGQVTTRAKVPNIRRVLRLASLAIEGDSNADGKINFSEYDALINYYDNNEVDTVQPLSLPPYDSAYKVIAFPILFNTNYYIKFYSNNVSNVEYQAVWFNGESPLGAVETSYITKDNYITVVNPITYTYGGASEFVVNIGTNNVHEYTRDRDNNIIKINSDTTVRNALEKQSLLYLFIKFPATIEEPIVVLEQPKFTQAVNNSLLNIPTTEHEQIAFSDTLIDYITGNVISPATMIPQSIHEVQQKISTQTFFDKYGVGGPNCVGSDRDNYRFLPGVFDEGMHKIIYKAFFNQQIPTSDENTLLGSTNGYEDIPDFIGYVDKNVEYLLNQIAFK